MKTFILLALTLLTVSSAFAADICAKKDPSTYDMLDCIGIQYKAADKELNEVYQKLLKNAHLSANSVKALKKAEMSWIKFRDDECAFEYSQYEGGTMAGVVGSSCVVSKTQTRTKELKDLLNDLNIH